MAEPDDITRSFSKPLELEEIILDKFQAIAALKKAKSLHRYGKAYATSKTGDGKSIMMAWVLKRMMVQNAIMVCPLTLIPMWEEYRDRYGLPFNMIITYDNLRGVQPKSGKKLLKHGLLVRDNDSFEVTNEFRSLVEDGLIICADECHEFKNDCDTEHAMMTLCSYVHHRRLLEPKSPNLSGVFFNSTTPFDQEKHCTTMCRTLGIITKPELVKGNQPMGLQELVNYCLTINALKTNEIVGTMAINSKNADNVVYSLCIQVLLPNIATFANRTRLPDTVINDMIEELLPDLNVTGLNIMDYPEDEDGSRQTIMNVHCPLDPIPTELIKWGYRLIQPRVRPYVELTQEMMDYYTTIIQSDIVFDERNGITHGQMAVHAPKVYERMVPMVRRWLDTVPNSKAVLFMNFNECIHIAERELADYGLIVITGETTDVRERERRRRLFQEDNSDYRVCVTMTQISATGTEYDDKHGNRPRAGFGLHSFVISNAVQCPGRLNRKTTKSNSVFFYIKVKNEDQTLEDSIDKNVSKKSRVFREALLNNGIIPPDSFVDIEYSDELDYNALLENAGRPEYKNFSEDAKRPLPVIKRTVMPRMFKSII